MTTPANSLSYRGESQATQEDPLSRKSLSGPPPSYSAVHERRIAMPHSEPKAAWSRHYGKIIITASVVVGLAILIACISDSYHKINEGYVGIYFRHGALRDRLSEPGVHFMMPFVDDYNEVKIRPETHTMDPMVAITKDGIENTFREINAITTVRKDKLIFMAKKFGLEFKKALLFDRIKEDLRLVFCKHDEATKNKF